MADLVIASTADANMSDYPFMLQASGGDPAIDYTAADARQLIAAITQAGVCGLGDFRVTQRAAGANLSVDIAGGRAAVPGTSIARQGTFIADSTGTVNTGTAGNITVPGTGTRTHRVILRIRDKQAAGTTYGYSLEVLEDTGSGMPALPASSIDLASIAVPAGAASITDAMITDRRAYACPQIPLAVTTLSSTTASVPWAGIPGGIKALEIDWSARCDGGPGAAHVMGWRINGDTGATYGRMFTTHGANGTGTGAVSYTVDTATYGRAGVIPGTGTAVGIFGFGQMRIPRWSTFDTSTKVNVLFESMHWGETGSNGSHERGMSAWIGSAQPHTLTIIPITGSFIAGSQFILRAIA